MVCRGAFLEKTNRLTRMYPDLVGLGFLIRIRIADEASKTLFLTAVRLKPLYASAQVGIAYHRAVEEK